MTEIDKAIDDGRRLVARLQLIAATTEPLNGSRLYGVKELADHLGIESKTVSGYLSRGQAPEPYARLASGPVWTEDQIEAWKGVRCIDR